MARIWHWQGQETTFVTAGTGHRPRGGRSTALRAGSESELSELDRELIRNLQQDGRMTFVDLAETLKVAEKTVRKRVAELRSTGLIEITAVTDPRLFGYEAVALLGLRMAGSQTRSALAHDLFEIPAVDYVVTTKGRYDLLVEVLCPHDSDLARVIDREIRPRPGVREIEVFPYLRLHYQQPAWDAAQVKRPEGAGRPGRLEVDPVDAAIVRQLSEDGRVKFLEVARQAGVSEGQIRNRFARMAASGALRVVAIVNPQSLGYRTTAWLCISVSPSKAVSDLADRLAALPSVAYLAVCAGRFDILAEVVCRDKDDLLRLLDRDVRGLQDISRIETLVCDELLYRRVVPTAAGRIAPDGHR